MFTRLNRSVLCASVVKKVAGRRENLKNRQKYHWILSFFDDFLKLRSPTHSHPAPPKVGDQQNLWDASKSAAERSMIVLQITETRSITPYVFYMECSDI